MTSSEDPVFGRDFPPWRLNLITHLIRVCFPNGLGACGGWVAADYEILDALRVALQTGSMKTTRVVNCYVYL